MKKLSEYKNEEALELLADLIEPAAVICADTEIANAVRSGLSKIKVVKMIIKNHKHEVIEILALLDNIPLEEYECNLLSLPSRIIEILNDEELMRFFNSQGQNVE